MSAFAEAALAKLDERGIPLGNIEADTFRLEPFGSAFLLRFDGVALLTSDEVMELLGATPAAQIVEETSAPDHTNRSQDGQTAPSTVEP